MRDVTADCQKIIKCVYLVNAVGNRVASAKGRRGLSITGGFTVLHIVDVLKGNEHKKLVDAGT